METPSSTRRITRSQAKSAFSNNLTSKKIKESEKGDTKKSKQRTCLFDITNDSPIIGVASGNVSETPISSIQKQSRSKLYNKTPGSGEALLRSQVKNLLQKVEQEAEISKFLSFGTNGGRHGLKAFLNSPAGLLAPTPANTPQVLNFGCGIESLGSVLESPIEDQLTVSKVVSGISTASDSEKDIISRSLFLDFSDKTDSSSASDCSSVVTYLGSQVKSPSKDEDDDASIWSIQVNASTHDDDDEEEVIEDDLLQAALDFSCEDNEEMEEYEEDDQLDELCEGLKNVNVNEEVTFKGKHIRYMYNSEDELVEEEVEGEGLRLKGLPTPKGKHLRFQDDEDE